MPTLSVTMSYKIRKIKVTVPDKIKQLLLVHMYLQYIFMENCIKHAKMNNQP